MLAIRPAEALMTDTSLLQATLVGIQAEKENIEKAIAEIKTRLGRRALRAFPGSPVGLG